jgi:magnesium-dependent phosphatase-1
LSNTCRKTIKCRLNTPIHLYEDVPEIFDALADDGRIVVAYASRTWEPSWAKEALKQFPCGSERTVNMWSISSASGWGDHSKVAHLKTVSDQTNISIKELVFFDNEMRNIRDVAQMGVHCGYCPDGLSRDLFLGSLSEYSNNVRKLG